MYHSGGWNFDFGKMIAYRDPSNPMKLGPPEIRFRIKKRGLLSYNGTFWMYGFWSNGGSDKEIIAAYEHWQIERVFGL